MNAAEQQEDAATTNPEKKRPIETEDAEASDRPAKKAAPESSSNDNGEDAEHPEEASDDVCLNLIEETEACDHHPSMKHVEKSEELLDSKDYSSAVDEATKVLDALPPLPVIAHAALVRGRALMRQAEELEKGGGSSEKETKDAAKDKDTPDEEMKDATAIGDRQHELYEKAWNAFGLSNRLNPDCHATQTELDNVTQLMGELPPPIIEGSTPTDFDVIVVGGGAAGIGVALMLTKKFGMDSSRVLVVERGERVGASFERWPAEMRFISPSFNQQGWTDSFDLNAIAYGSSPAFSLGTEHPTGKEYATYLQAIAMTNQLNVRTSTEVTEIRPVEQAKDGDKDEDEEGGEDLPLFSVDLCAKATDENQDSQKETVTSRFVVWAAGEFQYPRTPSTNGEEKKEETAIAGSEYCLHNSQVTSWASLEGDEFVLIGGYESGIDACVNLAKAGKNCTVLASTPCWKTKVSDPSSELAPYTAMRLREVTDPKFHGPAPKLMAPLRVTRIEPNCIKGGYDVIAEWTKEEHSDEAPLRDLSNVEKSAETGGEAGTTLSIHTHHKPVLCTGFEGSVAAAASHLFATADADHPHKSCLGNAPLLTEDDESTKVPGVFLVGPSVQHDKLSFCFVYKFRQRFAVVANAICSSLGIDTKGAVAECRIHNMYLDDFERCGDTCGDVC